MIEVYDRPVPGSSIVFPRRARAGNPSPAVGLWPRLIEFDPPTVNDMMGDTAVEDQMKFRWSSRRPRVLMREILPVRPHRNKISIAWDCPQRIFQ